MNMMSAGRPLATCPSRTTRPGSTPAPKSGSAKSGALAPRGSCIVEGVRAISSSACGLTLVAAHPTRDETLSRPWERGEPYDMPTRLAHKHLIRPVRRPPPRHHNLAPLQGPNHHIQVLNLAVQRRLGAVL